MQEVELIHQYVRTTATLALNWFFFACTVNAAVAGFLVQSTRVKLEEVRLLPWLFAICNSLLAIGFSTWLPGYYAGQARRIAEVAPDYPSPLPHFDWSMMAYLLAVTCFAMAAAWVWFFVWPKTIGKYLTDAQPE